MTFIRPETPADIPAVRDLVAAAFGADKVARLVDLIRRSPYFVPGLSLVAPTGRAAGSAARWYAAPSTSPPTSANPG